MRILHLFQIPQNKKNKKILLLANIKKNTHTICMCAVSFNLEKSFWLENEE